MDYIFIIAYKAFLIYMNKQQQLIIDTYPEEKQSNQFEKLKSDLKYAQQFLDDTKVYLSRKDIRKLLFNNLKEYYIALSLHKKLNGEIEGDWRTSDAGVFKMSIDDIPDEIVEVVYKVYNVINNMAPIKSLKLYTGPYKKPLETIFKKYPEYRIQELFREMGNSSLQELFAVAYKRVKAGYDSNKSIWQITKAIREYGDMLELTNNNAQQVTGGGVVLNLNVNNKAGS